MDAQELRALKPELDRFLDAYAPLFGREQNRAHGRVFVQGLLRGGDRRNVENIAEALDGPPVRTLQVFLASGAWDDAAVVARVRDDLLAALADDDAVLNVGETGFPKKGDKSVGVKRQYSGTLGRTDNCQVGVFLNYSSAHGHAFLDRRLFLPQEWAADADRRAAAGVPAAVVFRTKPQLGLAMIADAVAAGVPFRWVRGDSVYGDSPTYVQGVRELGKWYVVDASADARVWTDEPQVIPAERRPRSRQGGRPCTQPRVVGTPRRVDEVVAALPEAAVRRVPLAPVPDLDATPRPRRQPGRHLVHPTRLAHHVRLGRTPPPLRGRTIRRGNHPRLRRPHPGLRRRVEHVPRAQRPDPLHERRTGPVHAVPAHPPDGHPRRHRVRDHLQRQLRLRPEDHGGRHPRLRPTGRIVRPLLGQIQPAVPKRMALRRAVVDEHPDLAVVRPTQGARILPLHAHGFGPLLGKPGRVDVQHRVGVAPRREQILPHLVQHVRVLPGSRGEEHLERADGRPVEGFRNVLGVAAVPAAEQPLHEHPPVRGVLLPAESGGMALQEAVEFRLKGAKLLFFHEGVPQSHWQAKEILYPKVVLRKRLTPAAL